MVVVAVGPVRQWRGPRVLHHSVLPCHEQTGTPAAHHLSAPSPCCSILLPAGLGYQRQPVGSFRLWLPKPFVCHCAICMVAHLSALECACVLGMCCRLRTNMSTCVRAYVRACGCVRMCVCASVCMCARMHTPACICGTCARQCACMRACLCACVPACLGACVRLCLCACAPASVCACVRVRVCACARVRVCACCGACMSVCAQEPHLCHAHTQRTCMQTCVHGIALLGAIAVVGTLFL